MALAYTNVTIDILRASEAVKVGGVPAATAVRALLVPKGQSNLTTPYYTHLLLVNPTVDVRDDFLTTLKAGPNADVVGVPDKNGTRFTVLLVRRKGRGTALDLKECLLLRTGVTFPTDDV
jgi:hypothetical protein